MPTPHEKLAESLEVLKELQNENGAAAIRTGDISRTHRERLVENGFLIEVLRGWYIPSRPNVAPGDSTSWYASYWRFCAAYLNERFKRNWCLSPDQSLIIHSGNWTVPQQLLIRSPLGKNNTVNLPYNTSLYDLKGSLPGKQYVEEKEGLQAYTVAASLIYCSPGLFTNNPTDIRTALMLIRDASDVLTILLDNGHSAIAGRLAGAFRNVGRDRVANEILKAMESAGYNVREADPFADRINPGGTGRPESPYVVRVRMMWQAMRGVVIARFPKPPGLPKNKVQLLKHIAEVYVTDAYHSLSIEGYRVTPELIERVRSGSWNPDRDSKDTEQRNALAARGYWLTYQAVLKSLEKILAGNNPGGVVEDDHSTWYRELFSPSVLVGLLKARDLAGYRNGPVYIRNSMHVPLNRDAVLDAMPEFFNLLKQEEHAAVRVMLGHFIFVYIHPYFDGNGRIGRFLMNSMLIAGGYPWTVVPVAKRKQYMEALEQASVYQNIEPFTNFLTTLVESGMKGEPLPAVPNRDFGGV